MRVAGERVTVCYPHGSDYQRHGVLVRVVAQNPSPERSMTCKDIWEVMLDNGQIVVHNEFWLWKARSNANELERSR